MRSYILKALARRCAATVGRLALACVIAVNLSPEVARAADAYAAAYVAQNVPALVEVFKPASASVTMRNTGTAAWIAAQGDVFLATQRPQDNYYWCIQDNPHGMYSGNRVLLPHDVLPGEDVTFAFVVKPLCVRIRCDGAVPVPDAVANARHVRRGDARCDDRRLDGRPVRVATGAGHGTRGRHHRRQGHVQEHDRRRLAIRDGYSLGSTGPPSNTSWGVKLGGRCQPTSPPARP